MARPVEPRSKLKLMPAQLSTALLEEDASDGLRKPNRVLKSHQSYSSWAHRFPFPTWRLTSVSMINVRAAGRAAEIMTERAW